MAVLSGAIRRGCFFMALSLAILIAGCSDSPILVGYAGPQQGKYSDLGVQGRNGVTLAIEEINAAGGINGRKLKLIIRDDEGSKEGAIRVDQELIDAGVDVIIGHMISAQTITALEKFKDADIVFIGPTTSTNLVQGIKDNFFRVVPTLTDLAHNLAQYTRSTLNKQRVAFVWDTSNSPFTKPYKASFAERFTELGGKVVGALPVTSSEDIDWQSIIAALQEMQPDLIVAVIPARDLAAFSQYCKLLKTTWTISSSMWGFTQELIQTGGKSVEGVLFAVHYFENTPNEHYKKFQDDYKKRFGWTPNFAASFGYESVRVLAEAIRRNGGKTHGLGKVIPGISFSSGILGPFTIDEYGDVKRPGTIVTVRDGKFVAVSGEDE